MQMGLGQEKYRTQPRWPVQIVKECDGRLLIPSWLPFRGNGGPLYSWRKRKRVALPRGLLTESGQIMAADRHGRAVLTGPHRIDAELTGAGLRQVQRRLSLRDIARRHHEVHV